MDSGRSIVGASRRLVFVLLATLVPPTVGLGQLSAEPSQSAQQAPASAGAGRILRVGPGRPLALPSQAARVARDNDIVEIDAGLYRGDVAEWRANNLVLRAAGGRVHLDAAGQSSGGKATWVISGRNTTVEGIEFSGSRVPHSNGAGIRHQGVGLTIRRCYFHGNQMGILTGQKPDSDILIEHSVFARNTVDYQSTGRLGHNIYIGNARSFTLRYSHVHEATTGHNVKSRARQNLLLYNRIMDGRAGGSSYLVDLPNGGRSYIIGNVLHQGARNDNPRLISYAAEGAKNEDQRLFVINNTFVNDHRSGIFVQNRSPVAAVIMNNIMVGPGFVAAGAADITHNLLARRGGGDVDSYLFADKQRPPGSTASGNLLVGDAGLLNRQAFDYRLVKSSPAIDAARAPGSVDGFDLTPTHEHVAPDKVALRKQDGQLDIGAYEYGSDWPDD